MIKRPLSTKLLLTNVATLLLAFTIVGALVYYGLTSLSRGYMERSRQQADAAKVSLSTQSNQNIEAIRKIYQNALERKGKGLLEKDRLTVAAMAEDNSFNQLRTFLEQNAKDDPDMILSTFFIEESGELKAWQYVTPEHPKGLSIPIEYDRKKKSWAANDAKGRRVVVSDPAVSEVRSLNTASVRLKKLEVTETDGSHHLIPVFDCTVPIFKKFTQAKDIIQARKKHEAIGYLRYVLSLSGMEKAIEHQKSVLQGSLTKLSLENEAAERQSLMIANESLRNVYFLLIAGFLLVLALAYVLASIASQRVTRPVKALTVIAGEMARGNYTQDVNVQSDDEIGILANAFRDMSVAILKRDEDLAAINRNLERIVEERTSQLKEQLTMVSSLLNNMKQAVFSVDSKGLIVPPVSHFANSVFGKTVSGTNVFDSLYKDSDRKSESWASLEAAMLTVFGEDELQWDLMEHHFPSRIAFHRTDGERVLKIAYNPLWNERAELEKLMYVVEDITEVIQLEKKIEIEKAVSARNIQMLQELGSNDPQEIKSFFANSHKLLKACRKLVKREQVNAEDLTVIQRNLHTLKGNARAFKLSFVSEVIHHAETEISAKLDSSVDAAIWIGSITSQLSVIHATYNEYSKLAERVFRIENEFQGDLINGLHRQVQALDLALSDINQTPDQLSQHLKVLDQLTNTAQAINDSELNQALVAFRESIPGHDVPSVRDEWVRVRQASKAVLIRSASFHSYPTSAEIWIPVLAGIWAITTDFNGLVATSVLEIRQQIAIRLNQQIHRLVSHTTSHRFELLEILIRSLEPFASADSIFTEDQKSQLDGVLADLWGYIGIMSRFNAESNLSSDARTTLISGLMTLPKDLEQCRIYLENFRQGECIILSALRSFTRNKKHPAEFLNEFARVLRSPDLKTAVSGLLGDRSLVQDPSITVEELLQNDLEKHSPALLRSWISALGARGYWYIRQTDLIQLLDPYIFRAETAAKSSSLKMVEVIDTNLNSLRQLVVDFSEQRKNISPTDLTQAFERLMHVPIKPSLFRFASMIKEVSKRLSKQVDFKVKGDEITINRDQMYLLNDALVHLLRNCLDHGVESSEDRQRAGKKEFGLIEIQCRNEPDGAVVIVRDDGRGINPEEVIEKAIVRGLIDSIDAEKLNDAEKMAFIFEQGFSTRESVTELSGRGIGLDIVKANIIKLGAVLELKSKPGAGTEFVIRLPFSAMRANQKPEPHRAAS